MFKRFTDDFDWRYELKPGELIDSLDGESIWYKSTCLDIREYNQPPLINEPDAPMRVLKEAYIAYRYYDDVEGHKQDEEGKYVGWSNKYDEWISVSSPTI